MVRKGEQSGFHTYHIRQLRLEQLLRLIANTRQEGVPKGLILIGTSGIGKTIEIVTYLSVTLAREESCEKGQPWNQQAQAIAYPQVKNPRTRNVKNYLALADLLCTTTNAPATVGIVTGAPGTGKSIAAYLHLADMEQRLLRPPTPSILLDVVPQVTPKALLNTISSRTSGQSRSGTSEAFQQALMALEKSHTRLLVLDNADYLKQEHLELINALIHQMTCSFLLIGSPRFPGVIKHTTLATHVGPILPFQPLAEEELIASFLPHLVLPGWAFDPHNESDRWLGTYLWRNTRPSLRRLRMILSYAGQLAQIQGQATITLETIRLAISILAPVDPTSGAQREEEA